MADPLPIHFLTLVLNGEPFIRYHIGQFSKLPCEWHWHVVEGAAALQPNPTGTRRDGGRVLPEFHEGGRSIDGTSSYLEDLVKEYPGRITVYRKRHGVLWPGKIAMANAPLKRLRRECLLWQVDVDELWTSEQMVTMRRMFLEQPRRMAALFWCWYFVGPQLVITTRNGYGNNPVGEWRRVWRFRPGMRWASHAPPILVEPLPDGRMIHVVRTNPFRHDETEAAGLVFQHMGYVLESQVRFKATYYDYPTAVEGWRSLQAATQFPVRLADHFPWVTDETLVDRAEGRVTPRLEFL